MSNPYIDQAKVMASLSAENGLLLASVQRLTAEVGRLRADLRLATDTVVQLQEVIERQSRAIDSYERDRLHEAGKGKVGSQ